MTVVDTNTVMYPAILHHLGLRLVRLELPDFPDLQPWAETDDDVLEKAEALVRERIEELVETGQDIPDCGDLEGQPWELVGWAGDFGSVRTIRVFHPEACRRLELPWAE